MLWYGTVSNWEVPWLREKRLDWKGYTPWVQAQEFESMGGMWNKDSFYKEAVHSCVLWSLIYFAVLLVGAPRGVPELKSSTGLLVGAPKSAPFILVYGNLGALGWPHPQPEASSCVHPSPLWLTCWPGGHHHYHRNHHNHHNHHNHRITIITIITMITTTSVITTITLITAITPPSPPSPPSQ